MYETGCLKSYDEVCRRRTRPAPPIMPGKIDERAIVDKAATCLTDHRCLHAVVEDLLGNAAADRLEGCHVTAQNRLHVLVKDEPGPATARRTATRSASLKARRVRECWFAISPSEWPGGRTFERKELRAVDSGALGVSSDNDAPIVLRLASLPSVTA